MIKVKVIPFAEAKDKLHFKDKFFELANDCDVSKLLDLLSSQYNEFNDIKNDVMIAVNDEYCQMNYKLKDNDVVAIIPPVGGG